MTDWRTDLYGWTNDQYDNQDTDERETIYCLACDLDVIYAGDPPTHCPYCGEKFETEADIS